MIQSAKGQVFYGIHFYPGVAEYKDAPDKEPYRIFLNENTIREMDATFQGRPVYVRHVSSVPDSLEETRENADGWVIESFYNQADGKHWVKFIVVTDKGLQAIKNGWKLSNSYAIQGPMGPGGVWNGVTYAKEVKRACYEHLGIVPDPRYAESVVYTPEQFKAYNENHLEGLRRVANENDKGSDNVLQFFKREKVKNDSDLSNMVVVLPKSKKEYELETLVNEMDKMHMDQMCNMDHHVMVGDEKMKVNDLVAKYNELKAAVAEDDYVEEAGATGGDEDHMKNEEEEEEVPAAVKPKEKPKAEKKENSRTADTRTPEKKKKDQEEARRLQNAGSSVQKPVQVRAVRSSADRVALGKSRYGS